VDAFSKPELTPHHQFKPDTRISDRPMYGFAHADLKGTDAGTCGTYLAASYYLEKKQKRRDELLAKYKLEAEAEA
jgi:hypothetical protein